MKILKQYVEGFDFSPTLRRTMIAAHGGRNSILSFCQGTAFSYKDFEIKLDLDKPQWSDNCGIVVQKDGPFGQNTCEYCTMIKAHNLKLMVQYYDKIQDFSKIQFNRDGTININAAIQVVKKDNSEAVKEGSNITSKSKSLPYEMMSYIDQVGKKGNKYTAQNVNANYTWQVLQDD